MLSRGRSMRLSIAAVCWVLVACVSMAADEPAAKKPRQAGGRKAAANEADTLKGSTAHVYKTVNGTELKLYVFAPEGEAAGQKRPAIVFFFGGGWTNGSPTQFAPQSKYLASRGMVAIV